MQGDEPLSEADNLNTSLFACRVRLICVINPFFLFTELPFSVIMDETMQIRRNE